MVNLRMQYINVHGSLQEPSKCHILKLSNTLDDIYSEQRTKVSSLIQMNIPLSAGSMPTSVTSSMALTKGRSTTNSLRRNQMSSSLSIPSVVLLLGATDIVIVGVVLSANFHVLFHVCFALPS